MYRTRKEKNVLIVILFLSLTLLVSLMGGESELHVKQQQQREYMVQKRANYQAEIRNHRMMLRFEEDKQTRINHEEDIADIAMQVDYANKGIKTLNTQLTWYTLKVAVGIIGISVVVTTLFFESEVKQGTVTTPISNT